MGPRKKGASPVSSGSVQIHLSSRAECGSALIARTRRMATWPATSTPVVSFVIGRRLVVGTNAQVRREARGGGGGEEGKGGETKNR